MDEAFHAYYEVYTNVDSFKSKTIAGPSETDKLGRLGLLLFGFDKMTEDLTSFLFGHGPGSISYLASTLTTNKSNGLNILGSSYPLMSYMYELGIWGPLLLIIVFYKLFKKWKNTRPPNQGLERLYFDNIPVLLVVFFGSLIYTAALNNFFLCIYFAFNISYLNQLHKYQCYSS